ncbi:MaoC/PaaZ C-terminal domain-containing protein [Nocardia pseudobrasiliensis]|uniref:MaoC dehydratase-like protein n=1 Tax=Nocardia pseudobrasiliensis TaxID=45979 RepID=A0A370HPM2_9NOCA|nr:MaoC/PaaZ C-terminal domain-containing protein [Nocardia pseudobrasiliensis]RDI60522.1 MaoC dehydratase-like protein [Nocardia pseudobrasiliensis]
MCIAPLNLGDTRVLKLPPISRTTLALYAGASGDHNRIHIDIDACRAVGIDDVFAHGMLSMAYLGRVLTDWVPQEYIRSWHVRFSAITPVHAEPVCTATVTAVEGDLAELELAATLADGTVTLRGIATIALK